jgi:hypothetical protein
MKYTLQHSKNEGLSRRCSSWRMQQMHAQRLFSLLHSMQLSLKYPFGLGFASVNWSDREVVIAASIFHRCGELAG